MNEEVGREAMGIIVTEVLTHGIVRPVTQLLLPE